jgi:hypothetical protein
VCVVVVVVVGAARVAGWVTALCCHPARCPVRPSVTPTHPNTQAHARTHARTHAHTHAHKLTCRRRR